MQPMTICSLLALLAALGGCAGRAPSTAHRAVTTFASLDELLPFAPSIGTAIAEYRLRAREWPISLKEIDLAAATSPTGGLQRPALTFTGMACLPKSPAKALVVLQSLEPQKTYVFEIEVTEHPDAPPTVVLSSPRDAIPVRAALVQQLRLQLDRPSSTRG